jgi:hypothetical protein
MKKLQVEEAEKEKKEEAKKRKQSEKAKKETHKPAIVRNGRGNEVRNLYIKLILFVFLNFHFISSQKSQNINGSYSTQTTSQTFMSKIGAVIFPTKLSCKRSSALKKSIVLSVCLQRVEKVQDNGRKFMRCRERR